MASIGKTINFVIKFLWVTSKIQIVTVFLTLFTYYMDYSINFKIVLSINVFVLNLIIANTLFKKDEYLQKSGFYRLFNISAINIKISKSLIIISFLSVHMSLLLTHVFKVSGLTCFLFINIIVEMFLINILFTQMKLKILAYSIIILTISFLKILFNIPQLVLFTSTLLLISFYFLFKVHHAISSKII